MQFEDQTCEEDPYKEMEPRLCNATLVAYE
jgi:hypothetical protein